MDQYEKNQNKIVNKIYSNKNNPHTLKDIFLYIRDIIKTGILFLFGKLTLDDDENYKLIQILLHQSVNLKEICFAIYPGVFPEGIRFKLNMKKISNSLLELNHLGLIIFDKNNQKFSLTNMAKNIFDNSITEKSLSDSERDALYEWTLDIGDKQYRAYDWNDNKVQCLLTVDAALLAGILFVLQLIGDDGLQISNAVWVLFAISFVFLVVSILVCLIHSIPILNSKLGDGHNLRTIVGIESYARYEHFFNRKNIHEKRYRATEKYYQSLSNLTKLEMLHMNAWQIVGMSRNNVTSNYYIRRGVISTIIGVVVLMVGTILMAGQNIL